LRSMKFFVLLVVFSTWVWAGDGLKLVEKWQLGNETVDWIKFSLVDNNGNIVMAFNRAGHRLIKPDKIVKFAPQGQGPEDLMEIWALFNFNQDIAYVEMPGNKLKIFKNEGATYHYKETRWVKKGYYPFIVRNGIFYDQKIFLVGYNVLMMDPRKNVWEASFIEIFDLQGVPLKTLLKKNFSDKPHPLHEMDYYLVGYEKHVIYLAENELKLRLISVKELSIEKEINLEIPVFYKRMPGDFYTWKDYRGNHNEYLKNLDYWRTSYSRIHKVLVEGDYLVLQMRTCDPKLKKFALLFYNADTFKLEKTVFTNDYLLGARAGRYYFFANGDPGRDEEADAFIIHVCTIEKKIKKGERQDEKIIQTDDFLLTTGYIHGFTDYPGKSPYIYDNAGMVGWE